MEHSEQLFLYVARLTGDTDRAADVVQETFARLITRPPRKPGPLKPWLFAVATNLARDEGRKQNRRRRILRMHGGRQPLGDPPIDPDAMAMQDDLKARVRQALDAIPRRDREVLLLREHGFTHREIAEAVTTTEKSIGTIIARALTKLESVLDLDRDAI